MVSLTRSLVPVTHLYLYKSIFLPQLVMNDLPSAKDTRGPSNATSPEVHALSSLCEETFALCLMATEPAHSRQRSQAACSSLRPSQRLPQNHQPESPDLTLTRYEDSLDNGPEKPGFSLQISSNSQDPVTQPQKDWGVAPTIVSQPANKGGWKQNT